MHQGIFLGDEKAINRVYPEAVRAAPERVASTAYIFSTGVDLGTYEPEDLPAQPRWTLHALAELAAVAAL